MEILYNTEMHPAFVQFIYLFFVQCLFSNYFQKNMTQIQTKYDVGGFYSQLVHVSVHSSVGSVA